jgi:xanthine dehydrogenase YagS FAD-binding subunit
MNRFSYSKSVSLDQALMEFIQGNGTKFIAGGTNLIDLMRADVERPDHLIDITQLPLNMIEETAEGGLRLGALVKNNDTAYHKLVMERYPILSKAILAGASGQIRNMATNGGNLLQRTRCYYFYDKAASCNKREPGSGCSAIQGYNRLHAILGSSNNCIATHPSDMCVALAALDATVWVLGKDGERKIPFENFHRLPGENPETDTNLQAGELITNIELPAEGFAKYYQYLKLRDRASYAFALVSVAAALELDGDTIQEARLALGGVAHKPWRDKAAEFFLKGKTATAENFHAMATLVLHDAKGYQYNNFKIELARRAIVRAFTDALRQGSREQKLFTRYQF